MNTALATEIASAYLGHFVPVLHGPLGNRTAGTAWMHEGGQLAITIGTAADDVLVTLLHEIRHLLRGDVKLSRGETLPSAEVRAGLSPMVRAIYDERRAAKESDCESWALAEAAVLRARHPDIDRALAT